MEGHDNPGKQGKCRAVGVSNFTVRHLEELLATTEMVLAVNQVEFNPFLYKKELLDYCRGKGIQLGAYSPLTRGEKLADPRIKAIAAKYSKTSAQIMVRWSLQHGMVVIPKSVREDRIRENSQVFDFNIEGKDFVILDSLSENLRQNWDPTGVP